MKQFLLIVLLAAIPACGSTQASDENCALDRLDIREAVVRYLVNQYDSLAPQFDDPKGRNYCLGFDFSYLKDGTAAPETFLARFAAEPQLHSLDWCNTHDGRLVSVGPVNCLDSTHANVWSFTWMDSRPSGSDCLHEVRHVEGRWVVLPECTEGNIYN